MPRRLTSRIRGVGLYMADGFHIEVDYIRAYGAGE